MLTGDNSAEKKGDTMKKRLRKPTMKLDWDDKRRVVTNQWGERFVMSKENAKVLYTAAWKVYRKRKD